MAAQLRGRVETRLFCEHDVRVNRNRRVAGGGVALSPDDCGGHHQFSIRDRVK
jgi:hypothetical protein